METVVRDLMTTPAVTCTSADTLAAAARLMQRADTGSVIVTDLGKTVGILTERDLLRAAATSARPDQETVNLWMTPHPDVLGPDEKVDAAWGSLTSHHYRHLPVVEDGRLLGVVSSRDLMGVARIRPATETSGDVPAGLEGVVVAETTVGDVRGLEGFFHYREYSAVDLAEQRSLEDVWYLLFRGELPDATASDAFAAAVRPLRTLPPGLATLLPALSRQGAPLDVLRTAVSVLGAELGWRPTHDIGAEDLYDQALGLCAVVPTILAAAYRLREGHEPLVPRDDLAFAANYLYMLTGHVPSEQHARAVEQYMILTIDHGFNASTFTARVITSTGADLGAAIVGAIGALSGPLHGGAPSRALDLLDAIGTPDRADAYIRPLVERGDRIMGFGHRVYKTDDPRSLLLRGVAEGLGGPLVDLAVQVERTIVDVLAELKPGRHLYANVEFYAGVVMHLCGIPRHMFTPTFAAGRSIGWSTHVMEQASHNRLIRPAARYVGPPPPQEVPAR
ncbi:MAG TPA: citrate/2-methylcitrate synthase [Acidimicrobiales bacterium]|jgi:citrate synthase|nr:citrate/2-methylcitrate synthase [Acidimicrobiales bacterium]